MAKETMKQDRSIQLQEWMNRLNKEYAALAARAGTKKWENDCEYRLTVAIERYEIPILFWELLYNKSEVFRKQANGEFRGPLKQPNIGGHLATKAGELKVVVDEAWVPIPQEAEKK